MNLLTLSQIEDYSNKRILIPLSGGINSATVLCILAEFFPAEFKPKHLFLYYTHLEEHSPDTLRFVRDLIKYAKSKFENVQIGYNRASVNEFFISQNMIPHPTISPCSIELKMKPAAKFYDLHNCDARLIGYVKHEKRRYNKAKKYIDDSFKYPILELTEQDCFDIVKKYFGWYPSIYDIRWTQEHYELGLCSKKKIGKRVFKHNNCLRCKNMTEEDNEAVNYFYPGFAKRADETAKRIGAYWGREKVAEVLICDTCDRF